MLPITIVDAFTHEPFKGNQAGVCVLDNFLEKDLMQQIAMEMNIAETAFLETKGVLEYNLRWFTPNTEVKLCGHATLAATHVLLQEGKIKSGDVVTYHTLSGPLRAYVKDSNIKLDLPELAGVKTEPHKGLKGLGIEILACEKNRDNYLVEVKDYQTLLGCAPDFRELIKLDLQGVIITTATGIPPDYDFVSRYFAPNAAIDEDPVTGSAHCFLAPYWAKKLNKTTFHALQASKRQGILGVALEKGRVLISGQAVTTLKGVLQIPEAKLKEKAA